MEKNINDIIQTINDIRIDVYRFITSTEHWLFYWIENKEVQDFIEEFPEDCEQKATLEITRFDNACSCRIIFDEHPYGVESIERFCTLAIFQNTVKVNYESWNDRVKEMKLEKLNKELDFYKKQVTETEDKIKQILGKDSPENSELSTASQIINFVLNIANWQCLNKGYYHKMSLHLQDIIPGFVINWIVVDNGELSFDGVFVGEDKDANKEKYVEAGTISAIDVQPEYLEKILETLKNINFFRP